jgi:hypothetical protein
MSIDHQPILGAEMYQAANPPAGAPRSPAREHGPEGSYMAGAGKPVTRQVTDLQDQKTVAAAKLNELQAAAERAESASAKRRQNHRGGNLPWPIRWVIPAAIAVEAATAYVAMEALVTTQSLAIGLAGLTALTGAGLACILANRRLNHLPLPSAARLLEGIYVAVVTVLRYDSLRIQGADSMTAAGAAALAALISALGLLGIEEIVAETHTFGIFLGSLSAWWRNWRRSVAAARLGRIQARLDAAAGRLQQHFLAFLLKVEGLPPDEARRRAAAFKAAVTDREA